MINQFLDWAQAQQDVWIVNTYQLLDWVRHPVPASQLNNLDSFKCSTPQVDPSLKICNGIPQNEAGLLDHCAFPDFPFFTCVRITRDCNERYAVKMLTSSSWHGIAFLISDFFAHVSRFV